MSLDLADVCFCGGTTWDRAIGYDRPPEGETPFDLAEETYSREYYRCPACGHLHGRHDIDLGFLYDGAYVDATYGDYSGIAKTFDRIAALPPEKSDNAGRVERIRAFAEKHHLPSANIRLLDIGAGLGVFPAAIKQLGWEVTAIDPDTRAARHMRERLSIPVIESDIFEIDRNALGRFDIVTLNKVLEHVVEPADLLRRAAAFLADGGKIYFEVPDGPGALREGAHREEFFIEHHHAFSLESAQFLARSSGLEPLVSEAIVEPSSKYTIYVFAQPA